MIEGKDVLGKRIVKIFRNAILWQFLFLTFFAVLYFYFILLNSVENTGKLINSQIERSLSNLFSYGEILYVQPTIESIANASENQFPLYIAIKSVDTRTVQFFSGNPEIESKYFSKTFSKNYEVSKLGKIESYVVVDYTPYIKKLTFFSLSIEILAIFLWLFLYFRIRMSIKRETVSLEELELVLQDLSKSNQSLESNQVQTVRKLIQDFSDTQRRLVSLESISLLAKQVSHDIRSPLTALNMVISNSKNLPEENRVLIRSAVNRINDIANQLLQKEKSGFKEKLNLTHENQSDVEALTSELLAPIVDLIVSEKRVQCRLNTKIVFETEYEESYGAFATINVNELKRVMSNILNNSVESFNGNPGRIVIAVKNYTNKKVISVRDNGKGIAPEVLSKLGELGVSHGKEGTESGSGLGIYHAKKMIESFGGRLIISSQLNFGTEVKIEFPPSSIPSWFVSDLTVAPAQKVLALDDDESILEIWKQRFKVFQSEFIDLVTFTSATEFSEYLRDENSYTAIHSLYLIDYELLNQSTTGLDLIKKHNLAKKAILVSCRYDEMNIRSECQKLGVKIIPKTMATVVPIEVSRN